MSDDGWIPLPDVSRGPAHAPPPPPAPPLDLASPPPVTPVPAASPPAAPKRRRRGLVAALAAVIALGGAGAAGAIVVTRDDADDSGDGGESVAVEATAQGGQPIAAEYLDETNLTPGDLSFPVEPADPGSTAPCSDAGALDILPTTSSGVAFYDDAFWFSVAAGSFPSTLDAAEFGAALAAQPACEYWHSEWLEQLYHVEALGDRIHVYYDGKDGDGNSWSGVDTYIVSGKVVGVVACSVWADEGWARCDEVVETFAGNVYDVAATYG